VVRVRASRLCHGLKNGAGVINVPQRVNVPQGLKPKGVSTLCGTSKLVPFPNAVMEWLSARY
jgi:hypothetical protein